MVEIIKKQGAIEQFTCMRCGRVFRGYVTEVHGVGKDKGFYDVGAPMYCAVCQNQSKQEQQDFYSKTKTKYDYI